PALGAGARAGDLVEHPADFGAGEVGVEDEPGTFSHERLGPLGAQALADRRGPSALPDDRAVEGRARGTVPEDGRLALVGDPQRRGARRALVERENVAAGRHRSGARRAVIAPAGAWRGPGGRSSRYPRRGRSACFTAPARARAWPRRGGRRGGRPPRAPRRAASHAPR